MLWRVLSLTLESAIYLLSRGPLVFGNEDQIRAIHRIERAAECVEAVRTCNAAGHDNQRDCKECSGLGSCVCCGQECSTCNGAGKIPYYRSRSCLDRWNCDEIRQAQQDLERP